MKKYVPINSYETARFCEVRTFCRLPYEKKTEGVDFAVIGIPFDGGCGFQTGSRLGPASIRNMSGLLRGSDIYLGVNQFEYVTGVDYGDVPVVPFSIESTYKKVEDTLTPIVKNGVIPICMGGDHSITLPELRALAKVHGPLALVQFDSHLDVSDAYLGEKYNHGSMFLRGVEEGIIDTEHSIQVGIRAIYGVEDIKDSERLGYKVITADEAIELGPEKLGQIIKERVGNQKAFLTFDIDFVDPAYAPGTGTIEIGGYTSRDALIAVRQLHEINFVGFDLVEVLPALDPANITAYLAAKIMSEFISNIVYKKMK